MGVGFAAVLTAVLAVASVAFSGAVAILERRSASVPLLTVVSGLACVALLALAGSSLMQLGRPQLIFAAFSNPSSSIFKLGTAWLVAIVASIAYLTAVHRAAYESTCRQLALVAFMACVLVLVAHAGNYVMPWRTAWSTWTIVLPFFGYAVFGAVIVKEIIDMAEEYCIDRRQGLFSAALTFMSIALYLGVVGEKGEELIVSRVLTGDLASLFWGLVIGVGLVVPCGLILGTRRNKPAFGAALAAVLAGSIGWQITVLELGSATWSFFAR